MPDEEIVLTREEALLVLAMNCLNEIPNRRITSLDQFQIAYCGTGLKDSYGVAAIVGAHFRDKFKHNSHDLVIQEAARVQLHSGGGIDTDKRQALKR